jgi:hypothetical protein
MSPPVRDEGRKFPKFSQPQVSTHKEVFKVVKIQNSAVDLMAKMMSP